MLQRIEGRQAYCPAPLRWLLLQCCLAAWLGTTATSQAQGTSAARPLERGRPSERELAGGESHVYEIKLLAGQFLHVVVEQRGIDVVATLLGPDGKQIAEVDSPNGTEGPEPVLAVAETAGTYRLVVRSLEKDAKPGRYEAKLEELLETTPQNQPRINALLSLAKAEQLAAQSTEAARRAAIREYESTLAYWRATGERAKEAETLNSLGYYHAQLGEPQQALERHTQALPLRRAVNDRKGEADTLNNIAAAHNALNEPQKALAVLQLALELRRALQDSKGEGQVLAEIGAAYHALNELPKALEYYLLALPLRLAAREQSGAASTLSNIAAIQQAQGRPEQALAAFAQALELWRAANDKRGEAITLGNQALLYLQLGQFQLARDHFNQSLALSRAAGDRQTSSVNLAYLGDLHLSLNEPHQALANYHAALTEFRATQVRQGELEMLNAIAKVYRELGQPQAALAHHQQALQLGRAAQAPRSVASTLGALAAFYNDRREPQKAIDHYHEALQLYRALGEKAGQARTLSNLGVLYRDLDAHEEALRCFDQALPLFQAVDWKQGEVNLLNSYGAVYEATGELPKALAYYRKAVQQWKEVGDKAGETVTLINLGVVYQDLGLLSQTPGRELKFELRAMYRELGLLNQTPSQRRQALSEQALAQFRQALDNARAIKQRFLEASALHWLGRMQLALAKPAQAVEYLEQALDRWRAGADRRGEAETLYALARAERARGKLGLAREYLTAAIGIAEAQREKAAGQQLRAAIYSGAQNYYAAEIGLLMQLHRQSPRAGFAAAALQVNERARARGLLELLSEARVDLRQGVAPELLEREQSLQQQLSARTNAQIRLLSREHTLAEAAASAKEIEQLRAEQQEVETRIRATSPHFAALTQPKPLALAELQQQVLDADTLLLEYALGEERSYLWAVTPTTLHSYELPKRAQLEAVAKRLAEALAEPRRQRTGETPAQHRRRLTRLETTCRRTAAELSRLLLAPVARQLGKQRLLIVADGRLQYLPFAVLPKPGSGAPLIVDHEVVSLPSASTLAVLRRELAERGRAPQLVAALADPVFDARDPRVKAAGQVAQNAAPTAVTGAPQPRALQVLRQMSRVEPGAPIPRLPFSAQEAVAIAQLAPAGTSKLALGFAANYAAATSPELANYRYLHFATHGLLNDRQPELTGLLLSLVDEQGREQNGLLRLGEVYNLKLAAELVVLSACETALGKEVKGEGLVGLTRGFMYAGAARVVASLWQVDDEATPALMKHFYAGLLGPRALPPAAALRQAQRALLRQPEWRSPYYWGAFVLQGEWR